MTLFRRPTELLFAFGAEYVRARPGARACFGHVVHGRANGEIVSWDAERGEVPHQTLSRAVAEVAGVSGGSSALVPRLLIGQAWPGDSILDLAEPQVLDRQTIDGLSYVRIAGTNRSGERLVLHVSDEYLIKMVEGPWYTITYDYARASHSLPSEEKTLQLDELAATMCSEQRQ